MKHFKCDLLSVYTPGDTDTYMQGILDPLEACYITLLVFDSYCMEY